MAPFDGIFIILNPVF